MISISISTHRYNFSTFDWSNQCTKERIHEVPRVYSHNMEMSCHYIQIHED